MRSYTCESDRQLDEDACFLWFLPIERALPPAIRKQRNLCDSVAKKVWDAKVEATVDSRLLMLDHPRDAEIVFKTIERMQNRGKPFRPPFNRRTFAPKPALSAGSLAR